MAETSISPSRDESQPFWGEKLYTKVIKTSDPKQDL